MGRISRLCAVMVLAAVIVSGSAQAQTVGSRPAGERASAAERGATTPSDLDRVNPGIGFGWFGVSNVPIGGGASDFVSAPVLGVRWWMGAPLGPFRSWGLDLGVGLSRTSVDVPPNDETRTAVLLHAGVPLLVSASQHVAIEFVPELNLGAASGRTADGTDLGGARIDLGARAGAEVFFGFMGIPQLSLEGSVGLFLSRENRSTKAAGAREVNAASFTFGTTRFNDPWSFFTGTVAARYYF